MRLFKYSQSPLGTLTSAGPDCHVSMFDEGKKSESLSGIPDFVTSLTSFSVTPGFSPSGVVEDTTPSKR